MDLGRACSSRCSPRAGRDTYQYLKANHVIHSWICVQAGFESADTDPQLGRYGGPWEGFGFGLCELEQLI